LIPVPVASTTSAPVASSSAAPVSAAPSPPSFAASGAGITYGPYNEDGTCRTASQVMSDIGNLAGQYHRVRVYGFDCDTVPNVLAACLQHNLVLFVGSFDLSSFESDIAALIATVNGDWSHIFAYAVGNELVNSGSASAGQVMSAVGQARGLLRAAGYPGPVITVDTCTATLANPELANESDLVATNCHPFFDDNTAPADSGAFLTNMVSQLRGILTDQSKQIIISETGYPSGGQAHGLANPTPENQIAAVNSIKAAFSNNQGAINYFNSYSTAWKQDNAFTFGAEKFWGLLPWPSGN